MRTSIFAAAWFLLSGACSSGGLVTRPIEEGGAAEEATTSAHDSAPPPDVVLGPHRCRDGTLLRETVSGAWEDVGSCAAGSGATPCAFANSELLPAPIIEWDGDRLGPSSACLPLTATGIATSSDGVWVVGDQSIYRWNDREWREVLRLPATQLLGVFVDGAGVWVFGAHYASPGWAPLVMRWSGARWDDVSPTNDALLTDMHGAPGAGPWAVGGRSALRWNGDGWHATDLRELATVRTVLALSPNDVWAFSSGAPETAVSRWDGVRWRWAATLPYLFGTSPNVLARASDDIWVSGGHHWDGVAWTQHENDVQAFASIGNTLFGFGGSDGCGSAPATTRVWRWNGGEFKRVEDGLAHALAPIQRWMNAVTTRDGKIWLISAPITVQC